MSLIKEPSIREQLLISDEKLNNLLTIITNSDVKPLNRENYIRKISEFVEQKRIPEYLVNKIIDEFIEIIQSSDEPEYVKRAAVRYLLVSVRQAAFRHAGRFVA